MTKMQSPLAIFSLGVGKISLTLLSVLLIKSTESSATNLTDISSSQMTGDLAVHCGVLIDGLSDYPKPDQVVVIRDHRIISVTADVKKAPVGVPLLDLS